MSSASRRTNDAGSAIVIVLGAMSVLAAIGLSLVLLSMTETMAAGNSRRSIAALYAAEAGIERVLPDLWRLPDWNAVLEGRAMSGFTDGAPAGLRVLADGRRVNLDEIVSLANCNQRTRCSDAAMDSVTAERPWGRDNPRWQLFAHGPIASLCPAGSTSPPREYVAVLVADDPAENDDDPMRDGRPGVNSGAGLLLVRAEAFGPDGTHRVIEATIARGSPGHAPGGYAAQQGQGRTGGGVAGGAVGMPGRVLQRVEMSAGGW